MSGIIIRDVTKFYSKGDRAALNNLSCEINKGEIFGIIGHNGSGKSTLLKILATIVSPTSGSILFENIDLVKNPTKIREMIGVFLEPERSSYWRLTGTENINRNAKLRNLKSRDYINQINEILKRLNLYEDKDKYVMNYSKGMRVKLHFASALIGEPDVLLLDEPFSALDYEAKMEAIKLIKEYGSKKKTVVICSNNLLDVQHLCSRVLFLNKGNKVTIGNPMELVNELPGEGIIDIQTYNIAEMIQWVKENINPINIWNDGEKISILVENLMASMSHIRDNLTMQTLSISYREKNLTDIFTFYNDSNAANYIS